MSQYSLPLNLSPLFSEENFFVSDCNREAYEWIKLWPRWSGNVLFIHGPKGAGKTHLGKIWAARARAQMLPASGLDVLEPILMQSNWFVEDVERLREERKMLHLFNSVVESGHSLLLTSVLPPARLSLSLPDLVSRLLAVPCVALDQPDDEVLAAAMRKQFADRQMKVDDEVIAYILPRIERSLAEVRETVERLDKAALAEHKSLTIPFVKRLLKDNTAKE